jgi:ParB-like chromosome segregation protein Spo0J
MSKKVDTPSKRKAEPAPPSSPTHIKELVPDPENRRKHNPRNIGLVVDTLHSVGAARSIVIDEDNVILAGNGVTEAAAEAGITRVRVIEADGQELIAVRRVGLTAEQKRALAIADNRTAELAEWDVEQLQADADNGLALEPWFSEKELAKILGQQAETAEGDATIAEAFQVLVTCKGESDQGALLERLSAEGYLCRALMS